MVNRRTIMKILVPFITFVAGILIPIVIDRAIKGVITDFQILIIAIIVLSILFAALIIALSIVFSETKDVHNQIINIQMEVLSNLDKAALQFGLLVEFIVDTPGRNDGASYEVSKKLIQEAKHSIVFLDAWTQTKDYYSSANATKKRQAYYDAIIQQIEKHKFGDKTFHKRIIQTPEFGSQGFTLTGGEIFRNYLIKCFSIQNEPQAAHVSVIKFAPLIFNAHIIMIDDSYLIWPILTFDPKRGTLRRHGAIFFNDPFQQFVPLMAAIYHRIDAIALPLEERHINF